MKKLVALIKDFIIWLKGIFSDEKGNPSSKRIVGMVCATILCTTLYRSSLCIEEVKVSESLVNSVALLAFGCLGLTSFDKFTYRKHTKKDEDQES